jgi:hypothetical protein
VVLPFLEDPIRRDLEAQPQFLQGLLELVGKEANW